MASEPGRALSPPPSAPSLSPSGAPSPPVGPPRLVNLYNVRLVATPKQCFICHRETTTCLATDGVTDFLYTCRHHLLDPGVSLFSLAPVARDCRQLTLSFARSAVCAASARVRRCDPDGIKPFVAVRILTGPSIRD